MSGVRLWARSEMRSRLRSLAVLGVLAALVGGLAMSAVAGARRTATVDRRSRRATAASDVMIFPTQLTPPLVNPDFSQVRRLPQVTDAGAFALAAVGIKELPALGGTLIAADSHLFETIERPLMRGGRLMDPTRDDEVIVTAAAARHYHLHPGSPLTILTSPDPNQVFTNNPPTGGTSIPAHVVGIGFPYMFRVFDPTSSEGFIVSPGVLARHPEIAHFTNLVLRLQPGTDTVRFRTEVAALLHVPTIPLRNEADDVKRVTHSLNVERVALLGFTFAVLLAGFVLVGQALIRSVYAVAESGPVLRGLGATRRQVIAGMLLPFALSAILGAGGSIGIAVALSSRFPLGLARQLEPDLGFHADWPVLAIGALLVATSILLAVAGAGIRATSPRLQSEAGRSRSLVMRFARGTGSLPVTLGAGLALERGQGARSLPVRPAIAGATAGVIGIVGAFGLIHGIDDSRATPARAGQLWQARVRADDQHTNASLSAIVATDPAVDAIDSVRRVDVDVDGAGIPVYALTPLRRGFSFVVLHGRAPAHAGEAVLGPSTAKALHRHIGDRITVAGDHSVVLRVVGLGLMEQTPHASYDQGVWTTPAALDGVLADGADQDGLFVTFRRGVKTDAGIGELTNRVNGAEVDPIQVPPDVIYLRSVRSLPRALAAFLVVLGLAALGHVLVTAVRRRRHDLAILRALGLRPRQTAACVAWQAMTVAVVALAIGIPTGVASGRWTWRVIADATPLRYIAPVAAVAALVTPPAAVALALAIAALPARRAARLRPAELLRTE